MFLVTGPDQSPPTASIKVSDEEFESLTNRQGIIPAPYMAKHKWVYLDSINRFSKKEWELYAKQAFDLVSAKLSKKQKKLLGLLPADTAPKKKAAVRKLRKK